MSKFLKIYLSFLSLLLLAGSAAFFSYVSLDASLYLSTSPEFEIANQHAVGANFNHAICFPVKQEGDTKLVFDFAEIQDIENEESPTKETLISFDSFETASNNALLFHDLSKELEKNIQRNNTYVNPSKTKLHVRLQVFII
jgi:hypothetical protein